MANHSYPAMRPEEALEGFGPRFGEYPVRLKTRRTYALQADAVLERRETAPNSVWFDARSNPDLAPTRGE